MASEDTLEKNDDAPLIDLNEASIRKLVAKAKRRGYVTYDELNEALPQGQMSTDQIEDIQTALSEMGVQIVESDEDAAEEDSENEAEEAAAAEDDEAGADVLARDGRGRAAQPRGRNRHRQAHRGRPRHDDHGPVREPDHLPRDHHVVRSAQQRRNAAARDPRSRRHAFAGASRREDGGGERGSRIRRNQRGDRRPPLKGGRGAGGRGRGSRARRGRRAPPAPPRGGGRGGG